MEALSALVSNSLTCVSFAGIHAGNRLSSDLRHLGPGEFKFLPTARKLSGSLRGSSMFSRMALGLNVSEDPDDMFEKYGKVVIKRNDLKPPSEVADDDAESLSYYSTMLPFTARNLLFFPAQIDAIGTKIKDLAEKQYGKVSSGDSKPNSWTLLDFGDVVVHIFLPQQRTLYNLEEFYGNATPIELPFENQPPFRS